jgi:hypothetical protein
VIGLVPPADELERQILAFPGDVALAWLVEQYHSRDHYHTYNMHDHLFGLITSTYGRRALAVVEHRIGEGNPSYGANHVSGVAWKQGTDAGRRILGNKFPRWYQKVRGTSYDEDLAKHQSAGTN